MLRPRQKLRSCNSHPTKTIGMDNTFRQEHSVFHFSFNFTKPFLSGSKYIWRTNCLDKCSGTFVSVYNQYYALVVVINQNKE